ncbi:hypothetical protein Aeroheme_00721 [Aeromonas sp. DSM 116730]|uniref:hypothetical protein n=1 Tax=Aeromonas sp. DSM 116730 TaxID=3115851 RepID=UPI00398234DC
MPIQPWLSLADTKYQYSNYYLVTKMKIICLVVIATFLSGCSSIAAEPKINAIAGDMCLSKDRGAKLTNEIKLSYRDVNYAKCRYEYNTKKTKFSHIADLTESPYTTHKYNVYLYDNKFYKEGYDHLLKTAIDDKLRAEQNKIDQEKAIVQNNDPDYIKQQEAEKKKQKKYDNVCWSFYKDMARTTTFTAKQVTLARPMYTGAFLCVAQGTLKTPHGNVFSQVELTGNPSNGVYEYKDPI